MGGQTWPCQFNPFNPAVNQEANGFVYEPLVFVNVLKNGATTPMLASAFKWSANKDSIVFTIRDGVKWSDGQPLTAADVAFTFNLMKSHSALDLYALWTGAGLKSVTAAGNKVTMAFSQPGRAVLLQLRQPGRHRAAAHLVDRRGRKQARHLGQHQADRQRSAT